MRAKDESNKRIYDAIMAEGGLAEVMDEEGRGFLFAPLIQWEGDHKTMGAVAFRNSDGNITEENISQFWGTLAAIVGNVQRQIPEDRQTTFRLGAEAFVRMMKEENFPTWEID